MQDLKFNCPRCKQPLEAPEEYFGQIIECPSCNGSIQVPMPKPPPVLPPKKYIPTTPQNRTPNNEVTTNVKQGAFIGAFVCFAIGIVLMFFSLWTFIIYSPLFLAAFILSIVAMAQKRIAGGISALLLTLIVPPLLFFILVAVRSVDTEKSVAKALAHAEAETTTPLAALHQNTDTPLSSTDASITEPSVAEKIWRATGWLLVQKASPIDDSTTYILGRDADDNIGTGIFASTPKLIIRHMEGSLDLYIDIGQYLGSDSILVISRVGSSPAKESEWGISTGGKAIFYLGNVDSYVRELLANNKLVIRVTPYGESPVTSTFNLAGLNEAIEPMKHLIR